MKTIARCFAVLIIATIGTSAYSQNWVPYQETIQTQVVYVPQPQPVIVYQWIPYSVQQNIVVEQQRFFCKTQTIISRPTTQWVLQPIVVYR